MTAGVVYCTDCGAESPDDSAFCAECGSRLEAGEPSWDASQPVSPVTSPPAWAGEASLPPAPSPPPLPSDAAAVKVNRKVVSLLPPPEEKRDLPLVARSWTGRAAALDTATSAISRNREIAYDLPGWEPLPPGESVVSRRLDS